MEVTITNIVKELEKMFSIFNNKFYNGEVQTPVITVHQDGGQSCYGWCTTSKCWKYTNEEKGENAYYEINITAEYLTRPFNDICATLLHEMVHLFNQQNEIQDCSRGGSYHNKNFKIVAEEHGLLIDKDEKYGWTKTSLQEDTKDFIKETWKDLKFDLYRTGGLKSGVEKVKGKSKSNSKKYVCPSCGIIARATSEIRISCMECDLEMECEENGEV
jgi:hypothetical protein